MSDLIPPHGGLSAPVCCMVPADERDTFHENASKLTPVPVSDADLSTVYRFGDGGLSPLTGPMDASTYHRVLDESVIASNGEIYAWTIPLALPIESGRAGRLEVGQKVGLVRQDKETRGHAGNQRRIPLGQAGVSQKRLPHRADRPSGCGYGPERRCGQDPPSGRENQGFAAAEAPCVRSVYVHARSGPQSPVRNGLAAGGCVSDPKPAAPCARICPGLRTGNADSAGDQRGGLSEPPGRRNQVGRRQRGNPDADLRSADRVSRVGGGG